MSGDALFIQVYYYYFFFFFFFGGGGGGGGLLLHIVSLFLRNIFNHILPTDSSSLFAMVN